MQNNSQGHCNSPAPKVVPTDDTPDTRPEVRGRRAELNPVNDATSPDMRPNINPSIEKVTIVSGVVTDCLRLNIRKEPSSNGEVLAVIDALSEVMVDTGGSSDGFYKICTAAGIEGFCMKKYIALRQGRPDQTAPAQ